MADSLFSEGGPHNIRRSGSDEYTMSISLPEDEHGRIARECPDAACSPGHFKVRPGTGITDEKGMAYCPYCRRADEPGEFATREQVRYAKDLVMKEAHRGMDRMIQKALGLGPSGRKRYGGDFLSIEMSYKPGRPPHVQRPFEEEMQRDVVCPHCGLDHVVFGLATWCADCGRDIFLTHVRAEYDAVQKMLTDVNRRREQLGPRVAARDTENALEDVVSIYEASLKAMLTRHLRTSGSTENDIKTAFNKKVGNRCQSIPRSAEVVEQLLHTDLLDPLSEEERTILTHTFEKRHPITHNLGVVDRKYLERVLSAEREGREIRVTEDEIVRASETCIRILESLQSNLLPDAK